MPQVEKGSNHSIFKLAEQGMESQVLPMIKRRVVDRLVKEFREEVEQIVSDEIAKFSFDLHACSNPANYHDELRVYIKQADEYVREYKMTSSVSPPP